MKKSIITYLLIISMVVLFTNCKKVYPGNPASETYVLVHGAWQGAWVWTDVRKQLERKGQNVIVIELPAHGDDQTSPGNVTIGTYRDKVIAAISNTKGNNSNIDDRIILVGHSLGGMIISAVAESIPWKIKKLVYIAAFVPANGETALGLASQDSLSMLGTAIHTSPDGLSLEIDLRNLAPIFCQDGSVTDKSLLVENYKPEPVIPFTNPVVLSEANFGSVSKYYIHTQQDNVISLYRQDIMARTASIPNVYSLNTGHSPFLSNPNALTNLLLKISNE